MNSPLWTTQYAPEIEDIPQTAVREYLDGAVEEPINLILYGPPGCGKTAAARALARRAHTDVDNDFIEINIADFFERTKSEISNDPRFEHFLVGRSDLSKRDMINHVLKESASYSPVSGSYKTVLLDNAEMIREDFQQALRRIMEQHHRSTQFIIGTRQPSKLIPALKSRCYPVAMRAPTSGEIATIITDIAIAEDVEYEPDGPEFIAGYANGNLRKAILTAQTTAASTGELTMQSAYETIGSIGYSDTIESMLDSATAGDFTEARKTLDSLLITEGLSGEEVLKAILKTARSRYHGPELARIHQLAADIDFDMTIGKSDRVHLSNFLASVGQILE